MRFRHLAVIAGVAFAAGACAPAEEPVADVTTEQQPATVAPAPTDIDRVDTVHGDTISVDEALDTERAAARAGAPRVP